MSAQNILKCYKQGTRLEKGGGFDERTKYFKML